MISSTSTTDSVVRVLIVEDDADTRANLQDILELDNFHVESVSSIQEALSRSDWSTVDVVILDRKLPDGMAEDVLPRLKAVAPQVAVVVITGFADLDGAIAALREGADDYLLKPVNVELLRKTLQRILERLHLEKEKRRSEAVFRDLVEEAGCVIVILRPDQTVAYFNPFAEELTGFTAQDVVGQNWFEIFIPASEKQRVGQVFQELVAGKPVRNFQHPILRRDGTRAMLLWNARRLEQYADGPAVLGIGQDISSLHEAQEKALRSERLAAIGQMVAGLAHESRNALQRSQACLEMLEFEINGQEEAMQLVRRIQRAQDHLHKLFEEVRGYVAPIQLDRNECHLSEVWREAWELLSAQRNSRKTQLRECTSRVDLRCPVDRFRLVQVFRNLLENSLAACQDPVEIEIAAFNTRLQDRDAVCIAVRDNGPGLNAEQRERIFQPFYTTKTQGTGLGMAIAQRIVEAHGGVLAVGDSWSNGAEILITLPRNP